MQTIRMSTVVGARPQFVKASAVSKAIEAFNKSQKDVFIDERLIHTGQHYDANMSDVFFDDLGLRKPDINLGVGSGTHGEQTGCAMAALERDFIEFPPELVLVYGDTNSTLAGALAAAKLQISVAHVEAGVRSFNREMPEEINRYLTDHLSSLLFCCSELGKQHLETEGMKDGVHVTGDVMYEVLLSNMGRIQKAGEKFLAESGARAKKYYVATIHRQENTDEKSLRAIFQGLEHVDRHVFLPAHPRLSKALKKYGIQVPPHVLIGQPLPYHTMLGLVQNAAVLITDSGGLQKEAYWLGTYCVVLREETEWVEIVETEAGGMLVGSDPGQIEGAVHRMDESSQVVKYPEKRDVYGSGAASKKVVGAIVRGRG